MTLLTCPECATEFYQTRPNEVCCSLKCANAARAKAKQAAIDARPAVTVWSCGGGVQSSAIAALICQGKLPKPDHAVMVDVGYEKTSTFENVRDVLQPALQKVGVTLQVITTTDYTDNTLWDNGGHLILPAYQRLPDGTLRRFDTHCSSKWKQKIVMRWLRDQGVERAVGWIGISTDEARRVKPSPWKWYTWRYPLVELGYDRVACHIAIYSMGWPRVLHSSCYICPQQDDEQWRYVKHNYPDDWEMAVNIDAQIREREPSLYLHRSGMPLPAWVAANPGLGVLSCGGGCEYCA